MTACAGTQQRSATEPKSPNVLRETLTVFTIRAGLAAARSDCEIAGPLAMMVFVGTLTCEFKTSLPIFAEHTLHGGIDAYSWLTTAFGIGSVAAGLVLMRWPQTGLWTTAFVGSTPLGAVVIGALAHAFGGRVALGAGIAGCLAAILVGFLILHSVPAQQRQAVNDN